MSVPQVTKSGLINSFSVLFSVKAEISVYFAKISSISYFNASAKANLQAL